jgi:hypothetical protein
MEDQVPFASFLIFGTLSLFFLSIGSECGQLILLYTPLKSASFSQLLLTLLLSGGVAMLFFIKTVSHQRKIRFSRKMQSITRSLPVMLLLFRPDLEKKAISSQSLLWYHEDPSFLFRLKIVRFLFLMVLGVFVGETLQLPPLIHQTSIIDISSSALTTINLYIVALLLVIVIVSYGISYGISLIVDRG